MLGGDGRWPLVSITLDQRHQGLRLREGLQPILPSKVHVMCRIGKQHSILAVNASFQPWFLSTLWLCNTQLRSFSWQDGAWCVKKADYRSQKA